MAGPTPVPQQPRLIIATPLQRQESDPLLQLFSATSTTPINVRTFSSTDLHTAVARGDLELASSLCRRAQKLSRSQVVDLVNQPNEHGWVALHNAAALADEEAAVAIIGMLLANGANVNTVDSEGFSALHWAAWVGGCDRVAALLAAGADANAASFKLGDTPLHRAARAGHADVITALVARGGANTRAPNRAFLSPQDVAGARAAGVEGEELLQPGPRAAAVAALTRADPSLRTLLLHHADCLAHVTREGHQEAPERVTAILARLADPAAFPAHELRRSDAVPLATDAQLLRAHSAAYVRLVRALAGHVARHNYAVPFTPNIQRGLQRAPVEAVKPAEHSDTTFSVGSLAAALRAAGSVCAAVDAVVRGAARNAFCCVRPPGHHAGVNGLLTDFASSQSCGFCIFNSVAVGALHALAEHPMEVTRVAIVDIDVHHGNGTEEIVRRWADMQQQERRLRAGKHGGSCGDSKQSLFFFSFHLYDIERGGGQQQQHQADDSSAVAAAADSSALDGSSEAQRSGPVTRGGEAARSASHTSACDGSVENGLENDGSAAAAPPPSRVRTRGVAAGGAALSAESDAVASGARPKATGNGRDRRKAPSVADMNASGASAGNTSSVPCAADGPGSSNEPVPAKRRPARRPTRFAGNEYELEGPGHVSASDPHDSEATGDGGEDEAGGGTRRLSRAPASSAANGRRDAAGAAARPAALSGSSGSGGHRANSPLAASAALRGVNGSSYAAPSRSASGAAAGQGDTPAGALQRRKLVGRLGSGASGIVASPSPPPKALPGPHRSPAPAHFRVMAAMTSVLLSSPVHAAPPSQPKLAAAAPAPVSAPAAAAARPLFPFMLPFSLPAMQAAAAAAASMFPNAFPTLAASAAPGPRLAPAPPLALVAAAAAAAQAAHAAAQTAAASSAPSAVGEKRKWVSSSDGADANQSSANGGGISVSDGRQYAENSLHGETKRSKPTEGTTVGAAGAGAIAEESSSGAQDSASGDMDGPRRRGRVSVMEPHPSELVSTARSNRGPYRSSAASPAQGGSKAGTVPGAAAAAAEAASENVLLAPTICSPPAVTRASILSRAGNLHAPMLESDSSSSDSSDGDDAVASAASGGRNASLVEADLSTSIADPDPEQHVSSGGISLTPRRQQSFSRTAGGSGADDQPAQSPAGGFRAPRSASAAEVTASSASDGPLSGSARGRSNSVAALVGLTRQPSLGGFSAHPFAFGGVGGPYPSSSPQHAIMSAATLKLAAAAAAAGVAVVGQFNAAPPPLAPHPAAGGGGGGGCCEHGGGGRADAIHGRLLLAGDVPEAVSGAATANGATRSDAPPGTGDAAPVDVWQFGPGSTTGSAPLSDAPGSQQQQQQQGRQQQQQAAAAPPHLRSTSFDTFQLPAAAAASSSSLARGMASPQQLAGAGAAVTPRLLPRSSPTACVPVAMQGQGQWQLPPDGGAGGQHWFTGATGVSGSGAGAAPAPAASAEGGGTAGFGYPPPPAPPAPAAPTYGMNQPLPARSAAAAADDDDIAYSFYPGTGVEDCGEANVWNAPIAPLWRERTDRDRDRDRRDGKRAAAARAGRVHRATHGRLAVRRVILERLLPCLRAFGPDLVLVSAGFDGGAGDVGNSKNDGRASPGMNLQPEDFAWITAQLMTVARVCCPGRVVSVLEGGYGQWKWRKAPSAAAPPSGAAATAAADGAAADSGPQSSAAAAVATAAAAGAAGSVPVAPAAQQPPPPPPQPQQVLYLRRDNLADNCAAHVRALVDDGATLFTTLAEDAAATAVAAAIAGGHALPGTTLPISAHSQQQQQPGDDSSHLAAVAAAALAASASRDEAGAAAAQGGGLLAAADESELATAGSPAAIAAESVLLALPPDLAGVGAPPPQ